MEMTWRQNEEKCANELLQTQLDEIQVQLVETKMYWFEPSSSGEVEHAHTRLRLRRGLHCQTRSGERLGDSFTIQVKREGSIIDMQPLSLCGQFR